MTKNCYIFFYLNIEENTTNLPLIVIWLFMNILSFVILK